MEHMKINKDKVFLYLFRIIRVQQYCSNAWWERSKGRAVVVQWKLSFLFKRIDNDVLNINTDLQLYSARGSNAFFPGHGRDNCSHLARV